MPPKTKKKKLLWLWIVLIVFVVLILCLVGLVLLGYAVSKYYGAGTVSSDRSISYGNDYAYEEQALPFLTPEKKELSTTESADSYEAEDTETAAGELTEKKVIKTGSLTIEVDKVEESSGQITDIAKANEGFVQSSNVWTDTQGDQTGTIIIKIPADKFESVFEQLKGLAVNVERENVSGQDVTEQYMDLQAQLKNYRAEEEQYLSILDKANTVDDILKVTKQLSYVRGNIERVEGRIKYLENVTDYSTITVYMSQEVKVEVPTSKWRPLNNLKTAFSYWVKALQWLLDAAVWIIIFLGPMVVVSWLVIWGIRRKLRRKKGSK